MTDTARKAVAGLAVALAVLVAAPAPASSARAAHVSAWQLRRYYLGRSITYRNARYSYHATVIGWKRFDQRKVGTQWFPTFRIHRRCLPSLGHVCPASVWSTVWNFLTEQELPEGLRPYRWAWFDTALGATWGRAIGPCLGGAAAGYLGDVSARVGVPVLVRSGVLASGPLMVAKGSPYVAAGLMIGGCVASVTGVFG